MRLRRVLRIRHRALGGGVGRYPLPGAGRALGQIPVVAEQGLEEAVVPRDRSRRPGPFQPAGDGVVTTAGAVVVLPAQAHLLDRGGLRLASHVLVRVGRAVGLAEGVAAGDERHRLLVVHRHPPERLADVAGRGQSAGLAVRSFRVDVDQAHLHGAERVREVPLAAVARVAQPLGLSAPVDLSRLPDVLAAAAEAEHLQAHRLHADVAREDHEVGPGDLPAVLLLDRPEQPARLVEVGVVGPTVQRREPLLAGAGTAAAVADPVGARAVPGHPDEERAVVAVVSRPPVLRVGHQRGQVLLQGREVEALELFGVVEVLAHRIGRRGVLLERLEVQLVRPPVPVGGAATVTRHRAFAFVTHSFLPCGWC